MSVDGGVTWRPAQGRATWTFTFTPPATGSVTVRARAVDDSGNLQAQPTTASFNIAAATCPCSLWPSQSPSGGADVDNEPVEVGVRFRVSEDGFITALRFYKAAANTGTNVGTLWSVGGTQLGRVTFPSGSSSGWQTAPLASPVPVTANTWYVVSYHTSAGIYYGSDDYFESSGVSSGPLYAARDGEEGSNGLYIYASSSTFPTKTYSSENYWADVVFERTSQAASGGGDTTAPTITITSPTSSSTYTTSSSSLTIGGTASDNVGVTQVTWSNSSGGSGTANGTTSWSRSGISLTRGTNVITVTARDAAGNTRTDTLTVTRR